MNYLEALNEQQKKAVTHGDGPLLILAGAGSGKTRVLTHRIAYLVDEKGVKPWNIIAITFTNKAAKEMKSRVIKLIGTEGEDMWVSTFHSACVRILRRDIDKLGYDKNFVIFDMSDQQVLIKECLRELNLNEKNFPPKSVLHQIGRAKDEMIDPQTYMTMYSTDFRLGKVARIYELYQKKLKINNALDFDDIIIKTIELFTEFPEVLGYYQSRFRYVLVDEYQDTNSAQFTLVSLLSASHGNICVVGDDDQGIYGWRGANIRNILDFEREFPGTKVIKLEQNYRSTQSILDAANHVIRNNPGRKPKKLWTENGTGTSVKYFCSSNEHEEAEYIIYEINKQVRDGLRRYSDFAVLYRMNAQSRVLEEGFMKFGVPYKLVGALKFYDRKEIKDLLAYLRLIHNPSDSVSLRRIINVPRRGIGKTTVESLEQQAAAREVSIFSLIQAVDSIQGISRAAGALQSFSSIICGLKAVKEQLKVSELIEEILRRTGYLKELEDEDTIEALGRIENLKEFISVAIEFERENEDADLGSFLENVSLVSDIDTLDEEKDAVVFMTFHSAKGLEFPVVFMAGMEEGVFPGYRSLSEEGELEEERRLCYVGITRAREQVYMTGAYCRTLFGSTTYNNVSRFVREMPEELVDGLETVKDRKETLLSWDSTGRSSYSGGSYGSTMPKSQSYGEAGVSQEPVELSNLKTGVLVEHKKFGVGVITRVEEEGDDLKLDIAFKSVGSKRLMAQYAGLRIIR